MPPTDGPTSGAPGTANRANATPTIANLLDETRSYPAPADIAATANVGPDEWARAAADPVAFWEEQARRLEWTTPWHTAHTWEPARPVDGSTAADHPINAGSTGADGAADGGATTTAAAASTSTAPEPEPEPELTIPAATWFAGGTLNVAVNCVDRHVDAGRGEKVALHFEGEPGDRRSITYAELQREVAKAANALTALGIGKGDRVVIYLPVIPETVIATLAVARIGAIHSLVFGGFSAEALRFRVEDTEAKLLITTDGQYRRGTAVPVKQNADAAVAGVPSIEHVLVVARTGDATPNVPWTEGRDVWWHDTVGIADDVHEAESFDAETPLFIIYTSGTTGKPKGLVHTAGGYLTQASWTHWAIFDAKDDDVHWCTADLAWVTAHTYEIYGPLSNGLTQVIYEGTPNTPHQARHFEIIERYGVTVYYTAPTLIRTLMTWFPDGPPAEYDLSSIRLLGTVGEAINPEAWMWFRDHLGRGETPVIDTWWQSETGSAVIAPLPGATTIKPGSGSRALPGLEAIVVDEDGETVPYGSGGYLVVSRFGPSLARTVWGNPERYRDSYWAKYWRQGYFFSGDGAKWDEDGDIWVLGRVDDVINVSGHRLSTIEIESSLVTHPHVGEAGVVGVDDPITGQAIAAFVIPASRSHGPETDEDAYWLERTAELREALRAHVANEIGPIAKPRDVFVVPDLPKTRSGKIMRRLLGDIVDGRVLGDTTSLQDEAAPHRIASIVASSRAAAAAATATDTADPSAAAPAAAPAAVPTSAPTAAAPTAAPR